MKVAYIRVSTEEQNADRQIEAMNKLGITKQFMEKISAKNMERPQLKAMLEFVREGDCVVVESFSRLSRSTKDLLTIIEKLQSKNVQFQSLKENIDTSTPNGRFFLTICGAMAQFERETTLLRQKEGIAIAKQKGKYVGRKPIELPPNFEDVVTLWKIGELTTKKAMEKVGMSANTFYRKVKELGR